MEWAASLEENGKCGVHFELKTFWCPHSLKKPQCSNSFLQSKDIVFRWCRKSARLATLPGLITSGYENYSPPTTAAHGHFSKRQWDINTFQGTDVLFVYWTLWKLCPHTRTHPFFLNPSDILTFKSCTSWPHMLIIYFPPLNFMLTQKNARKWNHFSPTSAEPQKQSFW